MGEEWIKPQNVCTNKQINMNECGKSKAKNQSENEEKFKKRERENLKENFSITGYYMFKRKT